jgi:peroxiredoxin
MKTLEQFVKEENISFPLIADTEKDIKTKYGSGRVTYLIDKQGVIRYIQKGVPENADFLKQLEMIQ